MPGQEVIAHPDAPHAAGADLDPPQHQLVGDSLSTVRRVLQRMGQDRLFDRRRNAVRVRAPRSRQPIDQAVGAVQLEAPPDLVDLLPAVVHDPAWTVVILVLLSVVTEWFEALLI